MVAFLLYWCWSKQIIFRTHFVSTLAKSCIYVYFTLGFEMHCSSYNKEKWCHVNGHWSGQEMRCLYQEMQWLYLEMMQSQTMHWLYTRRFSVLNQKFVQETNIKRQATRHDCLPSLLGQWEQMKWISLQWGKQYFIPRWKGQPRQDKNSCNGMTSPTNQPQGRTPFICTP